MRPCLLRLLLALFLTLGLCPFCSLLPSPCTILPRSRLNRNLAQTMRALPVLEEDQRLVDMVQNLDKR